MRIACGVSRNGANALNMVKVAEHYGLETSAFAITTPIFQRIFLDRLLTGRDKGWIHDFFVILIIFEVVYCIVSFMQAIFNYRVMGKIAVSNCILFSYVVK